MEFGAPTPLVNGLKANVGKLARHKTAVGQGESGRQVAARSSPTQGLAAVVRASLSPGGLISVGVVERGVQEEESHGAGLAWVVATLAPPGDASYVRDGRASLRCR